MNVREFKFTGTDVAADISEKYGYDGPLLPIYAGHEGAVVHKWHHYIPLYDRYLSRFCGQPVRFLEIGVFRGGSLEMWREFLGPEAVLFGIDIDPDCAKFDGNAGQVRTGSQDDPAFLNRVIDEMGGIDVVLDDGSHRMEHIRASLDTLFPRLSLGGIYVIEDLHTAYFRNYGGTWREDGYRGKHNFLRGLTGMIDDMHHWYHDLPEQVPALGGALSGIHIHDSFVVLEKNVAHRPVHSRVGAP